MDAGTGQVSQAGTGIEQVSLAGENTRKVSQTVHRADATSLRRVVQTRIRCSLASAGTSHMSLTAAGPRQLVLI